MRSDPFERTRLLYGDKAMDRLSAARVAVFGVGGVGGYALEGLARSGIGALELVDNDVVSFSNLNRQILALRSTVGRAKVEVAAERIADINPACVVTVRQCFFLPETAGDFDFSSYDYVIDAIDTVAGKIALAVCCHEAGTPLISAMGAGNKLDPGAFRVADLYETQVCPLARVMRRELKRRGIDRLKVVYSPETPLAPLPSEEQDPERRRPIPGSTAACPAVAGLLLAAEVVKDLSQG